MGLDMYITKRVYIGANYDFNKVEIACKITKDGKAIPINKGRVSEIIEQIGYWRKANAIHNWFVQNVQDGVDDCREYYFDKTSITDLLGVCETVLADHSKAEELLPTQAGFFFGSTDCDDYYYQDIKEAIKILNVCLAEDGDYYYQSSW